MHIPLNTSLMLLALAGLALSLSTALENVRRSSEINYDWFVDGC